jgi:hypothetical protein
VGGLPKDSREESTIVESAPAQDTGVDRSSGLLNAMPRHIGVPAVYFWAGHIYAQ